MADLAKLTKVFIKIRDARAKLSAEFKQADAKLEAEMSVVKAALLDYLKTEGVDSVRTSEGLVYRTAKTRYWTNDWESMHRFIIENGLPEFFEKRLNQGVVKTFLEENPEQLPPGLNVDSEYSITVRKA
jgi:hypothetical protein